MPQVVPLISQAAALADDLNELFDDLASDGQVTSDEILQLDPLIDQMKEVSVRAELAYQWGMAVLKGGLDGKRAREVELENLRFDDFPQDAA